MNNPKHTKHIATRRSDLYFLTHATIQVEPGWNSRTTFTGIAELAEDIAANGLIQPLRIRNEDGAIYLIDGERRHRAIAHGITTGILPTDFPIPVTIEKSENLSDRLFSQLSANTGVPFTLIEKARLYSRLRTEGIAVSDMAKRSQSSKQSIYQALTIIDQASPHLITLIDEGKISATFALDIITQHSDHATQDTTATAALAAATESGHTKATAKNTKPKPDQANPSNPSEEKPQPQPEESPEEEEEEDPPTTIDTPQSRKDTVNPPPNPDAYQSIKDATSTNRDGTSANTPTSYAPPDKRIANLDQHLENFHYNGNPDHEKFSTARLDTIEIILDYLRGDTDLKTITCHLQCQGIMSELGK